MLPLVVLMFAVDYQATFAPMNLPETTKQIVLVETDDWSSNVGTLKRFSRSADGWVMVGQETSVVLGRSGLAWGRGLQSMPKEGPEKVEGDGKAPAGVFRFGTAFGYGSERPSGSAWPYRQVTERDVFVDDPNSAEYNQWVRENPGQHATWKSAEKMRRQDGLYEWGIVVNQNTDPIIKGKGSAVFFHIWRGPGVPTAGCTAMSKENLLSLMRWLNPEENPIVIQVPKMEMGNIKLKDRLPE